MTSKTKSLAKYLLAVILLAFILYKTDTGKIFSYLAQISPVNIIMALLFVTLAQFAAAMRMRYFFRASGFHLNIKFAVILFYVGAFYNFLLPGGIGGDAYKVMLARKRMEMPTMKGIKLMVADRASGLCIIMLIMFASLYFVDLSKIVPYSKLLVIISAIITTLSYLVISWILLKQPAKVMLVSLYYSLYTQFLWVMTLWVIWRSLGNGKNLIEYVVLYCAASIASLIPVSVGGLGIKESTYYYGAVLIKNHTGAEVDGELGIVLSLCIFALSFIACLPGTLWLHKIGRPEFSPLHNSPGKTS